MFMSWALGSEVTRERYEGKHPTPTACVDALTRDMAERRLKMGLPALAEGVCVFCLKGSGE